MINNMRISQEEAIKFEKIFYDSYASPLIDPVLYPNGWTREGCIPIEKGIDDAIYKCELGYRISGQERKIIRHVLLCDLSAHNLSVNTLYFVANHFTEKYLEYCIKTRWNSSFDDSSQMSGRIGFSASYMGQYNPSTKLYDIGEQIGSFVTYTEIGAPKPSKEQIEKITKAIARNVGHYSVPRFSIDEGKGDKR